MLQERIQANAWAQRTIQSFFRETCELSSDRVALFDQGVTTTYAELLEEVDLITAALIAEGLGKGDVVSILPRPSRDFAVIFFAVLQAGGVVNPLNLMWSEYELAGVLERNKPRIIITTDSYRDVDFVMRVQRCVDVLEERFSPDQLPIRIISVPTSRPRELPSSFVDYESLRSTNASEYKSEIIRRVEVAQNTDRQFLCQTSGSTGLSKSVVWNHVSPLSTANFAAAAVGLDDEDSFINLTPFFHNSGICWGLTMTVAYGGLPLYIVDQFDPVETFRLISEHRITSTAGFAAHWHGMASAKNYRPEDFTIAKPFVVGDASLYDFVERMCPPGSAVSMFYGQTENGPLVAATELSCINREIRRNTNGRPLPGVELVVKDITTGERLPDGRPGEICYRSPFLFQGYLEDDGSVQRQLDEDGLFRSGDYGVLRNGYLVFIERLRGVVKSGGENVSLAKVTETLKEIFPDAFKHIQAIGVPDDYWGTKIVAVAVPSDPAASLDRDSFRSQAKARLASFEVPQELLFWSGDWPVSAEGRLDLKALQKFAESALGER